MRVFVVICPPKDRSWTWSWLYDLKFDHKLWPYKTEPLALQKSDFLSLFCQPNQDHDISFYNLTLNLTLTFSPTKLSRKSLSMLFQYRQNLLYFFSHVCLYFYFFIFTCFIYFLLKRIIPHTVHVRFLGKKPLKSLKMSTSLYLFILRNTHYHHCFWKLWGGNEGNPLFLVCDVSSGHK